MTSFRANPNTDMIRAFFDDTRLAAFRAALGRLVSEGTRVLDVACGTGTLTLLAADLGARVVAVEDDAAVAEMAGELVRRSRNRDLVDLRVVPSLATYRPPEDFDVIVCDLVDHGLLEQPQHLVTRYLAHLAPGGVVVPAGVTSTVSLAAVRLEPFGIRFTGVLRERTDLPPPVVLTAPAPLHSLDFSRPLPAETDVTTVAPVIAPGIGNALRVETTIDVGAGAAAAPDPMARAALIPIAEPVAVARGRDVQITLRYNHVTDGAVARRPTVGFAGGELR